MKTLNLNIYLHSSLTKGSHSANGKKKQNKKNTKKLQHQIGLENYYGDHPSLGSELGPSHILLGCYQMHLPVCLYCLFRKQQVGMRQSVFRQMVLGRQRTFFSPLSIRNITAGTRPALLLGQHDLQREKGKPKSPSNENIIVNASQVRNLLPLTPINSYKTLVLSCPRTGTQTLDFIKLNFLFFFTRPVMCV